MIFLNPNPKPNINSFKISEKLRFLEDVPWRNYCFIHLLSLVFQGITTHFKKNLATSKEIYYSKMVLAEVPLLVHIVIDWPLISREIKYIRLTWRIMMTNTKLWYPWKNPSLAIALQSLKITAEVAKAREKIPNCKLRMTTEGWAPVLTNISK